MCIIHGQNRIIFKKKIYDFHLYASGNIFKKKKRYDVENGFDKKI